jgi:hypothetical protein
MERVNMFTLDVFEMNGGRVMKYDADLAPRAGETITVLSPALRKFTVLEVDHVVGAEGGMLTEVRVLVVEITEGS